MVAPLMSGAIFIFMNEIKFVYMSLKKFSKRNLLTFVKSCKIHVNFELQRFFIAM